MCRSSSPPVETCRRISISLTSKAAGPPTAPRSHGTGGGCRFRKVFGKDGGGAALAYGRHSPAPHCSNPLESRMRLTPFLSALGVLAAVACANPDAAGIADLSKTAAARTGDFDGVPDLIVDVPKLASSWIVYDHVLRENVCS